MIAAEPLVRLHPTAPEVNPMPRFDAETDRINVFHVGDEYLFSHFFDRTDLFEELREYYHDDGYRFEVPADEFEAVRDLLVGAHFDPVVIEDPEPYCVVTGKYDPHAEILRDSVANWERRGHRFFLLTDERAVREAVERGAERVAETEFALGI